MNKLYQHIILFFGVVLFCTTGLTQDVNHPSGTGTSTVNRCGSNYYDNGGSGTNYANSCSSIQTICPTTPGDYVVLTFSAFNCENNTDYLIVHSGNSTNSPIIGSYTGTTNPPVATSSDASGCLTMVFYSDGSTRRAGWTAAITCTSTIGTTPAFSMQDCGVGTGQTICGDATLSGNSSGAGAQELLATWDGCLNKEHQASWYYFSPSADGTIAFTLTPSGADDYDFAIWGPYADIECPALSMDAPLRCSYAGNTNPTGLLAGSGDNTEGSGGNGFVNPINVSAGDVYVMVIDNYSSSNNPFDLDWNLSGGASLDCTVLPIELLSFTGSAFEGYNHIYWSTASEAYNNYFVVERSADGRNFTEVGRVNGAGFSNHIIHYSLKDESLTAGILYYRLRQVDFDGTSSTSTTIALKNQSASQHTIEVFPNPSEGEVSINVNAENESTNVLRIVDVTGKEIFTETILIATGWNSIQKDFSSLNAGYYFILIEDVNGGLINNLPFVLK